MKILKFLPLFLLIFFISACKSNDIKPAEETPVEPEVQEIIEEPEVEEPVIEEPEPEVEQIDEDVEFIDEPVTAYEDVQEEYLRSIDEIETEEEVTQEEFSEDKAAILAIIDKLSVIMEEQDAVEWLKYIDSDSIKYYKNPSNLRKAQKKLPNRLTMLKNIGDYFTYVFIPSRKISHVDEIRYISKNEVKAVEVKDDGTVVVYYFFKKINGQWYVHLPVL